MLIACANVAHLQLARGVDRQIELAIRAANGARRTRLFSQLLTESLVLSVVSGAFALALTWWGIRILRSMSLTDIARLDTAQIDWRLAAVAAGLSVLSAFVTGVWPAWHAAGVRINDVLKSGTNVAATPGGRRLLRDLLGTSEIALGDAVADSCGLADWKFRSPQRRELGFDPNRLFVMAVHFPWMPRPVAKGARNGRPSSAIGWPVARVLRQWPRRREHRSGMSGNPRVC